MVPSALKLMEKQTIKLSDSHRAVTPASMVDYSIKRRHQAYNVHDVKQKITMTK